MRLLVWIGCAALVAAPLAGQDPGQRREALLRQVMERFIQNVGGQAGLDETQLTQFRTGVRASFERRRQLEQRERELWRALEGQMRPGVAADADSLTRLLDALLGLREEALRGARADYEEYAAYLSPVQRAQVMLAWERFQRQVEGLLRRRMEPGPGRPGAFQP